MLRRHLGLYVLLFLAVYASGGCATEEQPAEKPNILLILTDDQERSTLRHMSEVQKRLVNEGRLMDEMVSTYPLCCPARTTILRGAYTHNHRVYGNNGRRGGWSRFEDLGLQDSTVATWLQDAGYRTALFGKFLNNYDGSGVPPGWDRWYAQHGEYRGLGGVNDQGDIRTTSGHADTVLKDEALGWVEGAADSDAPFFAYVAFNAPHTHGRWAPGYDDMFADEGVPRTPNFNEEDVSDKPEWIRRTGPLTASEVNRVDRIYAGQLRTLQTVDRFVAELDETLSAKGEMDNTYVLYYTDNGLHLGNHRLDYGKITPYEEDINFPLIVRGPGIPAGTTSEALVGDHDLAPTMASMGGAPLPGSVDGRDASPVFSGPEPSDWRDAIFIQGLGPGNRPPAKPEQQPGWIGTRTKNHTYAELATGEKELYDLQKDPHQVESMHATADAQLLSGLNSLTEELANCSGESCRVAENEAP